MPGRSGSDGKWIREAARANSSVALEALAGLEFPAEVVCPQ